MLQELANKQVDIILSLTIGILCTVLGFFLDRFFNSRDSPDEYKNPSPLPDALSIRQMIEISIRIQQQNSNRQEANVMAFIAVAIAAIVYVFYRQEILIASLVLTTAAVGLWIGVVLSSISSGRFSGSGWLVYVLLMLLFTTGAALVAGEAITPWHAPQYFQSWQQYVNRFGMAGLFSLAGVPGISWLVTHVTGIALLFLALWEALLLMYFHAAISRSTPENIESLGLRWSKTAARSARPVRSAAMLLLLLVCSYYMVSGRFHHWYMNEFPLQMNSAVNHILHGSEEK